MTACQRSRSWIAIAIVVASTGWCWNNASAQYQDQRDYDQDIDVLTRGPVHEAFAETVTFNTQPGIVVPRQAPEVIEELPPDQRPAGNYVTWIPGYWAWDGERDDFLWVSGIWRDLPPGRQWVPGYWGRSREGVQWISGYWGDAELNEFEYLPQPPESLEVGPSVAPPAQNQSWIPGCWVWHHDRYAWRPGYWAAGRQDWQWVPAHYVWTPRGYIFTDGYWDHTLERRGVLFAPVFFSKTVYARRGFTYSPSYAINLSVFSDQLFIRPRYNHYYFGDYYDQRYQDRGFFASFSFQSSRRGYDPIFAHLQWRNRGDSGWERRNKDVYVHRRDVVDARPPRTLRIQVERSGHSVRPGESRYDIAARIDVLAQRKDSPIRYQHVERDERQTLALRARGVESTRGERQRLDKRPDATSTDRNDRSTGATRGPAPRPVIISKRPDQRGSDGKALPKRHRVPETDPNSKAGTRPQDPRSDRGEAGDRNNDRKSDRDKDRNSDRDKDRDRRNSDPKDKTKDKPKDQPKADPKVKPKVEPKEDPKEKPKKKPRN